MRRGCAAGLTAPAPRANSASERVVPLKFYGDHPAFSVQSLGHRGLGNVRWREPYADTPSYVSFELHIWHAHTLPVLSAALAASRGSLTNSGNSSSNLCRIFFRIS